MEQKLKIMTGFIDKELEKENEKEGQVSMKHWADCL
jgi:hypothetical protein